MFTGQRLRDHGCPAVYVYDENGQVITSYFMSYQSIDEGIHHYAVDVSRLSGRVTIIMNGGYIDKTGSPDSEFSFSDIELY